MVYFQYHIDGPMSTHQEIPWDALLKVDIVSQLKLGLCTSRQCHSATKDNEEASETYGDK